MTQPGNQPDASSDRQPRNQQACGTRSRHAWQRVPAGSLHRRAQAMSGAPERLVAFVDGIGMTSPETLNAASPRQEVGGAGARVPANSAVSSRDCRLPNRHRLRMSGPVKVADTPRAVKVHRWPNSGSLLSFVRSSWSRLRSKELPDVSRSCPRYRKSPSGPVAELADGWSATTPPQSNVLGCSSAPPEAA